MSSDNASTAGKQADPFAQPTASRGASANTASLQAPAGSGRSQGGLAQPSAAGIVERGSDAPVIFGRGPIKPDPRKHYYDVIEGEKEGVESSAEKEDRLSTTQGGKLKNSIHRMFGIHTASHGFLFAFDNAMWIQHTLNGASQLQPGRAIITVGGTEFDMAPVVKKLGDDARRFYRCFADDIAMANKRALDAYDPYDPVAVEQHGWLLQVASERQLQRYPWLAHDSADACVNISQDERVAVLRSKKNVLAETTNNVDKMRVSSRVTDVPVDNIGGVTASSDVRR